MKAVCVACYNNYTPHDRQLLIPIRRSRKKRSELEKSLTYFSFCGLPNEWNHEATEREAFLAWKTIGKVEITATKVGIERENREKISEWWDVSGAIGTNEQSGTREKRSERHGLVRKRRHWAFWED